MKIIDDLGQIGFNRNGGGLIGVKFKREQERKKWRLTASGSGAIAGGVGVK